MQYRVETMVRLNEAMAVVEASQSYDACGFTVVHGIEAGSHQEACGLASQAALTIRMGIGGVRLVSGRIVMQKAELTPPPSWADDDQARFHALDENRCFFHGSWEFHKRLPRLKWLGWRWQAWRHRQSQAAKMTRRNGPSVPGWMMLPSPSITSSVKPSQAQAKEIPQHEVPA